MISLAALLTAVALAAVFIAVVWRLGRTAAGACLALGIILLLGSVSSCSYGMHFYMGDSAWPSYLFQILACASAVAFVSSIAIKLCAKPKLDRKEAE